MKPVIQFLEALRIFERGKLSLSNAICVALVTKLMTLEQIDLAACATLAAVLLNYSAKKYLVQRDDRALESIELEHAKLEAEAKVAEAKVQTQIEEINKQLTAINLNMGFRQ